ncbi:hypothetical protein MKZ38_004379 [Zalerion maritima]|uniref:2EXR domain-containing protein n=1 Tax=Zalerion maritima TaxID=339359 RepID=A0AAD5WRM6_9PEZI|nr:hypothetical protein MKZ38_004379 [Zalerion maritima]
MKAADAASDAEKSSTQAEPEILHLVVELDRGRILSITERVEKRGIGNFLQAHSKLLAAMLIDWASQARWLYFEQLQILLGSDQSPKPPWLDSLHKIARYRSAIKSMVKFAAKEPEVFVGIHIRDIKAPNSRPFSLSNEKAPLLAAVKNLVKEDPATTMEQLEKHLGTQDVEDHVLIWRTPFLKAYLHHVALEPTIMSDEIAKLKSKIKYLESEIRELLKGSFRFFPKLPPEIRHMIWNLLLPGPRVIKIYRDACNRLAYHSLPRPVLMHTNQDSRQYALKFLSPLLTTGPAQYINRERDILSFEFSFECEEDQLAIQPQIIGIPMDIIFPKALQQDLFSDSRIGTVLLFKTVLEDHQVFGDRLPKVQALDARIRLCSHRAISCSLSCYGTPTVDRGSHGRARNGQNGAIEWLLQHKAKDTLNQADLRGHTPSIVALLNRQLSTANFLVENGAKVNILIEETEAWRWAVGGQEWRMDMCCIPAEAFKSGKSGKKYTTLEGEVTVYAFAENGTQTAITVEMVRDVAAGKCTVAAELYKQGAGSLTRLELNDDRTFRIMELLLEQLGKEATITEEVVQAAAGNDRSGEEMMKLLLDKRGAGFKITEEVVEAAATNNESGEVMKLLLDERGGDFKITESIVQAATGNGRSGEEVMKLLLNKPGVDFKITESIVKAAATNDESGEEVMKLLLGGQATVEVTEQMVKTAVGTFDKDMMKMLLDKGGADFKITEGVANVAAGNGGSGEEVPCGEDTTGLQSPDTLRSSQDLMLNHTFDFSTAEYAPVPVLYNTSFSPIFDSTLFIKAPSSLDRSKGWRNASAPNETPRPGLDRNHRAAKFLRRGPPQEEVSSRMRRRCMGE